MRKLSGSLLFASLFLAVACSPATPSPQEPTQPVASASPPSNGGVPPTETPAAGGGSASAPTGSAPKMCGGIAGIQCPEGQYCSFAPEAHCGAADMSGTCARKPDACAQMMDEVCGCDDKTYSNACMAAQAGISVVMKGACTKQPEVTTPEGGLCGTRGASSDCAPGLYCAYKPDCGATDAGGTCTKKPTMCTKIYAPACGCDGKTYGSACTAAAAGMSVVRKGECKP